MKTLGFFGAGNMASAIIKALIKQQTHKGTTSGAGQWSIIAHDVYKPSIDKLRNGINQIATDRNVDELFQSAHSNKEVAAKADVVVIATKPSNVKELLEEIKGDLEHRNPLVITICAGLAITYYTDIVATIRLARVMPNVCCLVEASASGFCMSQNARKGDSDIVQQIFSSVGKIYEVKEDLMDAVTGVSGSGPAYVFQFIEAMADGGVKAGLPRHVAQQLALQTVFGAAKMLIETGDHPAVLKDMVASPGGTTIFALSELEKGGMRGTVINAVYTAAERSKAMSKM